MRETKATKKQLARIRRIVEALLESGDRETLEAWLQLAEKLCTSPPKRRS
jgi:hypothetical protein